MALLCLLAVGADAGQPAMPAFEQYPAAVSGATLQQVDLQSHPQAPTFRSRLQALEGRPANFAGHYSVQYWGCGSGCQQFAIVDVTNGRVFMNEDWSASYGLCHRADSNLLIVNPGARAPARMQSVYFYWDGSQLQQVWQGQLAEDETEPQYRCAGEG
ncbi:hypothetical protein [Pseudomaricurvus sp. HS19]|uniref:hypothetical protein n=1 Tax=Pseudomaricurvus sp. HS19 TaxID=2692626 RepID=UPI00136B809F|nr:hypothetical protein [Pseudomaricurvus sp. HS19]MYM64354.1 hypothetical protein [Pseudomaricurvus sp. HS19]